MRTNLVPVDETILFNLAAGMIAATATLTSDETEVTAADTVTLGEVIYTFVDALTAAVAASAVLTSDTTQVTAGKKVTIGTQVYTFIAALTAVYGGPRSYIPNQVLIGADTNATMNNLISAINGVPADAGVKYSLGTAPHPDVTAGTLAANAFTVTARVAGTAGNAIAKAEDDAHLDWDGSGAVLTGGVDSVANEIMIAAYAVGTITSTTNGNPSDAETVVIGDKTYTFKTTLGAVANQIKIGANGETTLNNLKAAINLEAGAGTKYGTGTTINGQVSAPTAAALNVADYDLALKAKIMGIGGEAYILTESATNITVSAGGVLAWTARTNSSADETLGNLVAAINGAAGEGTKYSVGTVVHPLVSAAAVATHATIISARTAGVGGNAIAKAEASTHLDLDGAGAVFTGGGSTKGKYIFTDGGVARRFVTTIGALTGTITTLVALYNSAGVLLKSIVAAQTESSLSDVAYEVEIQAGDYLLFTASATTSDLEGLELSVR